MATDSLGDNQGSFAGLLALSCVELKAYERSAHPIRMAFTSISHLGVS